MKIEFGCGETPTKQGFKTCDVRCLSNIDYICPAWEIDLHVNIESVDEIFSRHFFEHLTFLQGELVLEKWYKILKPNGKMEMVLPNIDFHIQQWLNPKKKKYFEHAKAGFWGWQRGEFNDTWDIHKSGYNFKMLKNLLISKGYKEIENLTENKHLWIVCKK